MDLSDLFKRAIERLGEWICFVLTGDYSFMTKEVFGISLLDILLFMAVISFLKWLFRKRRGKPLFRF